MWEEILTIGFLTAFLTATVRMAIPLVYAGLGEVFLERVGILNIGLEGVMLSGAFFSFVGATFLGGIGGGLICGILGGILVSAIHGFLTIKLKKDQSVSGIALNMFMLGVTSFFFKLVSEGQEYQQVATLSTIKLPLLSQIPIIGNAFFNQDILTYMVYLLIILTIIFYKRTALGLACTAIGENPRAADSAGMLVDRYQWAGILVNGTLGGLGGATLVLVQLGTFTENMISGRGYIAIAAVILGRYTPLGMFGSALLFGGANALQIRLQALGIAIPTQILAMLPYVITLIALLGAAGKNSGPAHLGKAYIREAR